MRGAISALVYYLLLPALVVNILWDTQLGLDSVRITLTAALVVGAGWSLGWLAVRGLRLSAGRTEALILAPAFPNATYMGLPTLDAALGEVGRGIAFQFNYFACTALVLSVGVMMAQAYDGHTGERSPASSGSSTQRVDFF